MIHISAVPRAGFRASRPAQYRAAALALALALAVTLPAILFLPPPQTAHAQQSRGTVRNLPSLTDLPLLRDQFPTVYEFVRTGQPSIRVLVVGSISNQGLYFVQPGSDVEDLIMYSGGPSGLGALRRPDVFIREQERPEIRYSISRRQPDGNRRIVEQVQLSDILSGQTAIPVLLDDDILLVETEQPTPPLYRDVISVVGLIGGIVSSVTIMLYFFGVIDRRNI